MVEAETQFFALEYLREREGRGVVKSVKRATPAEVTEYLQNYPTIENFLHSNPTMCSPAL